MKQSMKIKMILPMAVVALFTMTSCEHGCHECHYEDANNKEVELGEKCDEELEELEENGITVNNVNYEVHCHEH